MELLTHRLEVAPKLTACSAGSGLLASEVTLDGLGHGYPLSCHPEAHRMPARQQSQRAELEIASVRCLAGPGAE